MLTLLLLHLDSGLYPLQVMNQNSDLDKVGNIPLGLLSILFHHNVLNLPTQLQNYKESRQYVEQTEARLNTELDELNKLREEANAEKSRKQMPCNAFFFRSSNTHRSLRGR